jgi:hypothetical protein
MGPVAAGGSTWLTDAIVTSALRPSSSPAAFCSLYLYLLLLLQPRHPQFLDYVWITVYWCPEFVLIELRSAVIVG